jgi:hypothetical protein
VLRVKYELVGDLGPDEIIEVRETRGFVRVLISRTATLQEFVSTMNPSVETLLDGGQWFQLWKGEIVTVDSPENPHEGGTVARLYRGPMVQKGARRPEDGKAHAG